ncbi:hypothetical protein BDV24DRAFT_157595 [Aspergillus arachidicola]|uniref:Uncharacterized protein n=1 Tax=Aspergillus arachidicola TaxID=656916 RepID=A0A5N6YPG5_9EURO|nr:hypothetical protein BDV24DRAFT_157595 [Aspergillus arachidicola]
MSDRVTLQIYVQTTEQGSSLGYYPDKEGPIIDAAKQALEELGAKYLDGQYQAVPPARPPFYVVIIDTTPVDTKELEVILNEIWSSITFQGQPVPSANISVQGLGGA